MPIMLSIERLAPLEVPELLAYASDHRQGLKKAAVSSLCMRLKEIRTSVPTSCIPSLPASKVHFLFYETKKQTARGCRRQRICKQVSVETAAPIYTQYVLTVCKILLLLDPLLASTPVQCATCRQSASAEPVGQGPACGSPHNPQGFWQAPKRAAGLAPAREQAKHRKLPRLLPAGTHLPHLLSAHSHPAPHLAARAGSVYLLLCLHRSDGSAR
eukprot:1158289-Pelagomonas_calceolata.AAC.5